MGNTRLGWLERLMMDPSRRTLSHTDPEPFQSQGKKQRDAFHVPEKTSKEGGT